MKKDINFDKVMERITLKLTGNNKEDLKFLMDECEKYKTHKYSKEILRAIGRLIYDILPDDEKGKLNQISNNHNLGIEKIMEEINFQIYQNKPDKALVLIESLIKNIEDKGLYKNDKISEYYCFNNILEEIVYKEIFKPKKEIRQIPENYADIYFKYGNILFEVKRYDEAKIILEKAISYNPINTDYLLELCELYKMNKDWKIFLRINRDCLKYAYSSKAIAKCYRNFGYYYIEEEKYELAIALFYLSIHFDQEARIAHSELLYISNKIGLEIKSPDQQNILKLLKDNDIQFGANDLILSIAYSIGQEAQKNNQNSIAKYFYSIVFDLTEDNEIKEIMDKL
jgi:tetratricopeptide (TPR) repeat protein